MEKYRNERFFIIKKTPLLLEILQLNFSHVLSQCEEDEC